MNILFTSYYEKHKKLGGGEVSSYLLAQDKSKNNNVFFANSQFKGHDDKVKYVRFPGLRFVPLVYSITTFFYLVYYIIRYRIDQVHVHDLFTVIPAVIAGKLTHRGVVVTVRGYWFCCNNSSMYHDGYVCNGSLIDVLRVYPFWRWGWEVHKHNSIVFSRFLLRGVKVIAISKYVKKVLKSYNIDSVVDYGQCRVDLSYVKKAKKLFKYKGKKVVLYIGRLSKEKGVDFLIKAFKELKDKKVVLVVVGSGPEKNHLKQLAKGLSVDFVGRVSARKVFDFYKTAKVVVYPVLWNEPFGRVIAEAKAMNKPVVGTKSGGVSEQLRGYKKGHLVPKADIKALVKVLRKIV